ALLDDEVVGLIIALKAASLSQGNSGVRWEVIELLVNMTNAGIVPCIPGQGSVGASGDLAPLAHLSAVLIGEGEARINGDIVPGAQALAGLFAAERAMSAAFVAGAMTVDACLGSDTPFDARIHAVRRHRGQIDA